MDYGYLNVASVMFGIVAIIFPLISTKSISNTVSVITSFTCCLIAVVCQIAYQNYLVNIKDWGALQDTTSAVLSASILLVVCTIGANIWALLLRKRKTA